MNDDEIALPEVVLLDFASGDPHTPQEIGLADAVLRHVSERTPTAGSGPNVVEELRRDALKLASNTELIEELSIRLGQGGPI